MTSLRSIPNVRRFVGALLVACATLTPAVGSAQLPPPQGAPRFHGIQAGVYAGSEYLLEGLVIGGRMHARLDPWTRIDLMPSGELEFRRGTRDWQMNADVAVRPYGEFYIGGGKAWRNSIFDVGIGKETRTGYSMIVGIADSRLRPGGLSYQIELRWSRFVVEHPGGEDTTLKPRWFTVGLNYPVLLWR